MKNLFKIILYFIALQTLAKAFNPARHKSLNSVQWSANISPEIVNELKEFANLIPTATIDEIVAKHLLIDGNFRTAFKYLRSSEFTQLQRQLLNLPEVLVVLEFLHLTTENATTRHMGATTASELIAIDAIRAAYKQDDNDAMTTNTGSVVITKANSAHNFNSIEIAKGTHNNQKTFHKRPPPPSPPYMHSYAVLDDDDEAVSSFSMAQPLVHVVLLEDLVVTTNSYDVADYNEGHHHRLYSRKYHRRRSRRHFNNNYHHHHYRTLGTFTAFVAEILQHLPHTAYQNMIKEKCQRNAKFAEFYHALRSEDLKPLVEQTLQTSNIKSVIKTLNSHDVDVIALKPIAFQVISWGPNI